jgi:hypothetical protein
LNHRAQILKAARASIRKFLGGSHHQMVNLSMTSAAELRSHRIAIAACFAFRQEINSSALWDFFDSIDPSLKLPAPRSPFGFGKLGCDQALRR